MLNFIIWTVLFTVNAYFGIQDIRDKKPVSWRVALTWVAVGVSALGLVKSLL